MPLGVNCLDSLSAVSAMAITMLVAAMPLNRSMASCRVVCRFQALCAMTAVTTTLSAARSTVPIASGWIR